MTNSYYFKQTNRKFGLQQKPFIQIFEIDFPYPIASFLADTNSFEKWQIQQNEKGDKLKIFEKLVILFKQKREIEYGIFLALEQDTVILKNFDLGKSIQEITEISYIIPLLYQTIEPDFLEILQSQKAQFEAEIEFHLYYDLEEFPNDYQKIQNSVNKSISPIT